MQLSHTIRAPRRSGFLGLMFVAALAAGCDNPVKGEEHEEEAAGVSIRNGTTEVARYFDGEITGALPTVAAGQSGPLLAVVFLDHDGEPLDLGVESELTMRARPANTNIADFELSGFGGRVEGVAAGSTTIIFDLMHGNHADYSTLGIPVTVTAAP